MAKSTTKTVTDKKAPVKKAAPKPKAPSIDIEKVSEEILTKLKTLDIEHQLQADIEWCLGSYRYDSNPAGLFDTASKALSVFKQEQAKKTKGVTATLISGIEKALK
jgi:hypothetical protein